MPPEENIYDPLCSPTVQKLTCRILIEMRSTHDYKMGCAGVTDFGTRGGRALRKIGQISERGAILDHFAAVGASTPRRT